MNCWVMPHPPRMVTCRRACCRHSQKLKVSRKARTHVGRARREMKRHESKLVENTKTLLALKGLACNQLVTDVLKELVS